MATPLRLQLRPDDPANVLAPIVQDYREHFEARRYQAKRVRRYVASVFHSGIGCVRKTGRSRMSTKQSSAASFPIICPTAPVHALFKVTRHQ